jgi:hypothetical protein
MRALPVLALLTLVGCGGSSADPLDAAVSHADTQDGGSAVDGGDTDAGASARPDGSTRGGIDLASVDLTGLVNCYGVAICDPNLHFCIRYHDGSQGTPGNLTAGPACFDPSDTCANQGQPMNCSCIQADANLGTACQGSCVDNMNGTYDCYAKP